MPLKAGIQCAMVDGNLRRRVKTGKTPMRNQKIHILEELSP
jgi:hypothetical protein